LLLTLILLKREIRTIERTRKAIFAKSENDSDQEKTSISTKTQKKVKKNEKFKKKNNSQILKVTNEYEQSNGFLSLGRDIIMLILLSIGGNTEYVRNVCIVIC
jgi:hypothetical protein